MLNILLNILSRGGYDRFITAEQFGAIGDNITDDRESLQSAIDFASENGKILLLDCTKTYLVVMGAATNTSNSHCLTIPSNLTVQSTCSNERATIRFLPPMLDGEFSLKTSNFVGGSPVDVGSVSAVYIDHSTTPKNNISFTNIHFTTDRVKWFNSSNFITTIPVCIYSHNTNLEADYLDRSKDARNISFINCEISNFKRGSVSVKGRGIDGVTFSSCYFHDISSNELQLPSEDLYLFTEYTQDGLSPLTTSHNFNDGNLIDAGVLLYDVNDILIGTIHYVREFSDTGLGAITNNITTGGGIVQWTLGTLAPQVNSISVFGVKRTTASTSANINAVCLDGISPARNLVIENCLFENSLIDQPEHFIYITRSVDTGRISGNTFTGRPTKSYQTGGGVHIRGASYSNMEFYNNTFVNTKDNAFNFSNYNNFTCRNNIINISKDLSIGNLSTVISYGAGTNLLITDNTIVNTNKSFSTVVSNYAGVALTAVGVQFKNNTIEGLSSLGTIPTLNLLHDGNTYTTHSNYAGNLIALSHTTVGDILNVRFENNTFNIVTPTLAQPLIEGFTGLRWINNTMPTALNLFRIGETFKVNDVLIDNSNFGALRIFSAGTIEINNTDCVLSFKDFATYDDIMKNQTLRCTNIRRPSGSTGVFSVAGTTVAFLETSAYNIQANGPGGNLDFLDIRPISNINGVTYQITNTGSNQITIRDIVNATNVNKNFSNGGVNVLWGVGQTLVLSFDKLNNRWGLLN